MALRNVVVVSDATGETAYRLARAALTQYKDADYVLRRVPNVRTAADVETLVQEIGADGGVILYTLLEVETRDSLLRAARVAGVRTVDLLGPLLTAFTELFDEAPAIEPGRQYRMDAGYLERIEAMEYAFRHDDGMGQRSLGEADVVLVGPSCTGKTPLSMVLANAGLRVANVPYVSGQPLPDELNVFARLVVGLVADAEFLAEVRAKRLHNLKAQRQHSLYAERDEVAREIAEATSEFTKRGWLVVDVSRKTIEEIAGDILQNLHQMHPDRAGV